MDGATVGNPLGTVGMNVGSVVGMRVDGAYVGDADGAGVGAYVGDADGAGVGTLLGCTNTEYIIEAIDRNVFSRHGIGAEKCGPRCVRLLLR